MYSFPGPFSNIISLELQHNWWYWKHQIWILWQQFMLRSLKVCSLGVRFAWMAIKDWPGSQTPLLGKMDGSHFLVLSSACFPELQCDTSSPWAPQPTRKGDGASTLGWRVDSLWAHEHSMARALTRPQLQVRTQSDPANFREENLVMQPPLDPTRQPVHKPWLWRGRVMRRGYAPKMPTTLDQEGNFEIPGLSAPLGNWGN